jgi:hypothetical protein
VPRYSVAIFDDDELRRSVGPFETSGDADAWIERMGFGVARSEGNWASVIPNEDPAEVPHLPGTRQERAVANTIRRERPDVEEVGFDPDGEHVWLVEPDTRLRGKPRVIRYRLVGNAQRYLLGELTDEDYDGMTMTLDDPETSP